MATTATRKQLKDAYQISYASLKGWLILSGINHNRRILTPAEVAMFINHVGEPEKPEKLANKVQLA